MMTVYLLVEHTTVPAAQFQAAIAFKDVIVKARVHISEQESDIMREYFLEYATRPQYITSVAVANAYQCPKFCSQAFVTSSSDSTEVELDNKI